MSWYIDKTNFYEGGKYTHTPKSLRMKAKHNIQVSKQSFAKPKQNTFHTIAKKHNLWVLRLFLRIWRKLSFGESRLAKVSSFVRCDSPGTHQIQASKIYDNQGYHASEEKQNSKSRGSHLENARGPFGVLRSLDFFKYNSCIGSFACVMYFLHTHIFSDKKCSNET